MRQKCCTCAQDSYTSLYKKFRVNSVSLCNDELERNRAFQLGGAKCFHFSTIDSNWGARINHHLCAAYGE